MMGFAGVTLGNPSNLASLGNDPSSHAIVFAIVLGLSAAMPIGPVNVEIARRTLRFGFWSGVGLGLGAVTVDMFYAVLSTLNFVQYLKAPWILSLLAIFGGLFLGYLGVQCLRAAWSAWKTDPLGEAGAAAPKAQPLRDRSAYPTGVLMTLLNPMTLAFWFVAVPAALAGRATDPRFPKAADNELPMMCAGVFIGTATWVFAFTTLLALAAARTGARRPERRRKWLAAADALGGITLLAFAAAAFLRLGGYVP